jgi:Do/DeqQ family serine protease
MLKRLWLVFAQVCTVCVAVLFTVSALRPEWLMRVAVSAPAAQPAPPAPIALPPAQTASATSPAAGPAGTRHVGYGDAAKRALPAVVKIAIVGSGERKQRHPFLDDPMFQRFFGRDGTRGGRSGDQEEPLIRGEGSGVIVRKDGFILTNNHVVENAQQIMVELSDKRVLTAKIVGRDPETDLAVIKIEGDNFPAVSFANSDELQVGEVVLAIGNPFGVFGNSVTMGIVSALGRTQIGEGKPFESFIQTDAAINQGNSGGALVNSVGELVGINSSIFTRTGDFSGIGFAIPTAIAVPVMEQLITGGEVKRGYIGASLGQLNPKEAERLAIKETNGAFVAAVIDGGPASRAGLRPNDVIVEVNGKAVKTSGEAISAIAALAPNQTVPVKINRKGEMEELKITLEKRPIAKR